MLHSNKPTVSKACYLWRCFKLISHIIAGIFCATFVLPLASSRIKQQLIRWWCARNLTILNIQLHSTGQIPNSTTYKTQGCMFIANHISWVDILALMSVVTVRFIAKSEIRSWPVFGYLAARANVIFIDRSKRQEAKRMQSISVDCLNKGELLCFFPEGTTTDGTHMLPFKGSIVQAAIEAKAILQPVGIFYPNEDQTANIEMAFAGDTTLVASMHTILKQPSATVQLHYFAPINLAETALDRRALTLQAQTAIKTKLFPLQSDF